jgi:FkbM family methyltransferase
MNVPNALDTPLSETHLRALYALLPEVISKNLYGPRFSKQFQVVRQIVHPSGVTDIRTLQSRDGITVQVNLGDRLGCDIYYGFFQEYCDYTLFMALVTPEDTIVDVGANYGMYTLGAAKRLAQGQVIAFEPDTRSMALLKQNVLINHFERRVTCLDVCVGKRDGTTDFYATVDSSFSGIHDTGRSQATDHLTLPVRALDSILNELAIEKVDLVKIDVEGAEWEVLQGATKTLEVSDPVIMLEISQKNLDAERGERLSVALKHLDAQGYVGFWVDCDYDVSAPWLVFEESLPAIAKKQGAASTINYFLLKREGRRFDSIQHIFDSLQLDSVQSRNEMTERHVSATKGTANQDLPQAVAEMDDIKGLEAALWAEGVEKQIAIDTCRKLHGEVGALEKKLAESTEVLAKCAEETALYKAKVEEVSAEHAAHVEQECQISNLLAETSASLAARMDECSTLRTQLLEAGNQNTRLRANNQSFKSSLAEKTNELVTAKACNASLESLLRERNEELNSVKASQHDFKAMLEEKNRELAARIEENMLLKDKLAKASRELAAATSGFLGMLYKARKRLLKRGGA